MPDYNESPNAAGKKKKRVMTPPDPALNLEATVEGPAEPKQGAPVFIKDEFNEYTVTIAVPALNVRSGPGLGNSVTRTFINDKNKHVVAEEFGNWGRLKSGGWVNLDYTRKE